MHELTHATANSPYALQGGGVDVMSRAELAHCRHWRSAFVGQRKDHRFYELVEDTIRQGFRLPLFCYQGQGWRGSGDSAVLHSRSGPSRRHEFQDTGNCPFGPARVAAVPEDANLDGRMCGRRRTPRWTPNIRTDPMLSSLPPPS